MMKAENGLRSVLPSKPFNGNNGPTCRRIPDYKRVFSLETYILADHQGSFGRPSTADQGIKNWVIQHQEQAAYERPLQWFWSV